MFEDDNLEFEDDEFQWNIKKAARNLRRHGVSFERARMAFDDPYCTTIPDNRKDYPEARFNLIGRAGDREEDHILMVSYTIRGYKMRIFSARKAEPQEKSKYRNSQGGDSSWAELLDAAHRIKRKRGRSF